jgi:glutamate synthase (ferredoxin)
VNGAPKTTELPDFGWVRFRKSNMAEPHLWQPGTVKALQTVVGSTKAGVPSADAKGDFAIFSRNMDAGEAVTLRDLLEIRPA